MRTMCKLFLAVAIFVSAINMAAATATCPSIQTAINEIKLTTLAATTSTASPFHYSGISSYDSSTVDYYSNAQPTAVTPTEQLKRLGPALKTPVQLSADGVTPIICVYLDSATLNGSTITPVFSDAWQQAIVITSSGSAPPPPPPPPGPTVPVSVNITGLPPSAAVTITMTSATNTFKYPAIPGTHLFASIPMDKYTISASAYEDYTASFPVNPVVISAKNLTVAINYSKAVPPTPTPTPVSGEVVYSVIFPVVPGASTATMPLDDVYQDLIISNLVAGAVYAHLMTSAFPTLYFDKGYLEGSLMGQLMQETGDTSIAHYPAAKQLGSNINIPADAVYLLQINSGGPYQLNSYPYRAYNDVGGVGLINFVTLQKSLGYTVEAQDNGSQAKLTAPVSLDNKYFAPIAAAYFQYNGFLGVLYYTRPASYSPSSKVWAACWANLTKSSSPLPILDLMQNAGYNSGNGPEGPIINPFIQICAAPVDGSGQPTLAYLSIADYTLGPAQYLANIGASPNMDEHYPRYPRQIRFYIDELYNDQARMPAGTYTLNNSMPVPIPMLRTIFENSMGTLAYQSGGAGPYGFIAASDADTAFNSALAAANLTDASVLNLNSVTDRTQLFALLDTALGNLETNLHFKFTDTTEQDL